MDKLSTVRFTAWLRYHAIFSVHTDVSFFGVDPTRLLLSAMDVMLNIVTAAFYIDRFPCSHAITNLLSQGYVRVSFNLPVTLSPVADYQRAFENRRTKCLYRGMKAERVSWNVWLRFCRLTETLTGRATRYANVNSSLCTS
jgi:hypothetical protein